MPEFNVIVHEINSITLAVEAENDIEAARLVEEDINMLIYKGLFVCLTLQYIQD